MVDDDGWFDDDDDYWSFNDGNFLNQAGGLAQNWDKVKRQSDYEEETAENMFLLVLEEATEVQLRKMLWGMM